ncbi:hypothetical protein [Xenorhabdus sp. SGI246]|uniref:hypothetical protein n=1 Tax=Xenorhabdus sp. SGI246 TaxID=3158263 RepID=UPI00349F1EE6
MKEIRYSAKIQEQQTLSDAKGVGPDIDKLKDKFKEGSIPLQTDFNQLIDIADIGRKACGQAPDQNGPGTGLKLGDDGTLNLKMGTSYNHLSSEERGWYTPLTLKEDILSVRVGYGLYNKSEDNSIRVGEGDGITVTYNLVKVKLADNKGLVVDSNGIAIKPGNGMKFSSDGALQLKLNKNYADRFYSPLILRNDVLAVGIGNGLITYKESNEIGVNPGNGLRIDGDSVAVKLADNKGLVVDSNGISIKPGNGIKVDADGVAIDPNAVLPKGMIAMFPQDGIPDGWTLCDGNNGTPNLLKQAIRVGDPNDFDSGFSIGNKFFFFMKL